MSRGSEKDTAKETGCSIKEARAAEHQAREDARAEGIIRNGDKETNSKPFDGSLGGWAEGFWDAIRGK